MQPLQLVEKSASHTGLVPNFCASLPIYLAIVALVLVSIQGKYWNEYKVRPWF